MSRLYKRSSSPSPRGSIFSNFETVQLGTHERLYLNAARLGDTMLLSEILDNTQNNPRFQVNCVDYMGRNALFLAVDSENLGAIEMLLEHVSFECIEEALLHSVSKGLLNIAQTIIGHPNYTRGEKVVSKIGKKDPFFRTEEKYQYPPDITPLILAAHKNDHEMIQLLLSHGYSVERPHAIDCQCSDCLIKQNVDSLKRSRSRLNAYKALASPAYMVLVCPDPITATFELRQEMMQVADVEKEFTSEYLRLVEQCMEFACEMMDLCRGTQEVEAVLSQETTSGTVDSLARLRLAINYCEKKFVTHPNCQQHLTSVWYGNDMTFLQSLVLYKKIALIFVFVISLPFLCIAYIINPETKVSRAMQSPVVKFISHTASHFLFLFLLTVATFGFEDVHFDGIDGATNLTTLPTENKIDEFMMARLRPARENIHYLQWLITLWIIGLIWIECKQIYSSGAIDHFQQNYNYVDFVILALYLASYSLRFVAHAKVHYADSCSNATQRLKAAFLDEDLIMTEEIMDELFNNSINPKNYFLKASQFDWWPSDPEILSDILFAVANVMSFARTTYIMPSHEIMGPLQISLGRMVGDIIRFIVVFFLVLFAFMVGMSNLYRLYTTYIHKTEKPASAAFKGLPMTVYTLFFSIFGLTPLANLEIEKGNDKKNDPIVAGSTLVVDRVGLLMFATYQVTVTIMLVNMLIAMMSHSFEAIQGDADVEWKFARTKLWLSFIDEGCTVPVPFSMIPAPKQIKQIFFMVKDYFKHNGEEPIQYDFSRRRENIVLDVEQVGQLVTAKTTYPDIIQRLIKRYLFQMDRHKYEKPEKVVPEEYDDDSDTVDKEPEIPEEIPVIEKVQPTPRRKNSLPEETEKEFMNVPFAHDNINQNGVRKAVSLSDMMREMNQRAQLMRASSTRTSKKSTGIQLEALLRGQKRIDAQLQDIQNNTGAENEVMKDNLCHIRHILSDNQDTLSALCSTMSTIQRQMLRIWIPSPKDNMSPTTDLSNSSAKDGGVSSSQLTPMIEITKTDVDQVSPKILGRFAGFRSLRSKRLRKTSGDNSNSSLSGEKSAI